ncbi:MAG TPA: lipid-A-disaccharide synthase [Pirellulaceae bacterium]|nr:lipid-A-disaccharide synthase [Pirellulaceae bacterium]
MNLFFSVGEPSGDLHAANLMAELKRHQPALRCSGFGGPKMVAAGCSLLHDMTDLAVMGLFPVLAKLPNFFRLVAQADRHFESARPDAVVLIDYPGFNWHIAKKAKARGIPVFYYGLPQMWAWAPWRVKKVRKYVDHALCKLPFEEKWFRQRGCNATYVGHPYFDELRGQKLAPQFVSEQSARAGRLVTILPGSRTHEVKNNLPAFLKAAQQIVREVSEVRFAVASYNDHQAKLAREMIAGSRLPIEVHVGRTAELIHLATCCLACSGSVSLELLYHAKPSVIHYKAHWLTAALFRPFILVKYITLVNLLVADELYPADLRHYDPQLPGNEKVLLPEYPTTGDQSDALARHCKEWLTNEPSRQSLIARLADLRDQVAVGGASHRAAEYILRHLPGTAQRRAA